MTDNNPLRPDAELTAAMTAKAQKIEDDPFTGNPRRIERRQTHLPGQYQYRVTAMDRAKLGDALLGNVEHLDPDDTDSPLVVWKALCEWQSPATFITAEVVSHLTDPNQEIN